MNITNQETVKIEENGFQPADILAPKHVPAAKRFLLSIAVNDGDFLLADQIHQSLSEWFETEQGIEDDEKKALSKLFRGAQEVVLFREYTYIVLRARVGKRRVVRMHPDLERFEDVSREHYLNVRDRWALDLGMDSERRLLIDFSPYFRRFPKTTDPEEIGDGISFMNRHLTGEMYKSPEAFRRALISFLQRCRLGELNLLANDFLDNPEKLESELETIRSELEDDSDDTPYADVSHKMRVHGFEAGWGRTVKDIQAKFSLLNRLLQTPDAERFENFLAGLPLVRNIVMVSPHGWFAQEDVLGKPDTGGQVTYVLDQARALERELKERFNRAGLPDIKPCILILTRLIPEAEGTPCDTPREKVHGTENCWIVRIPFRDGNGEPIRHWMSRFQIWPYLEGFAEEAHSTIITQLLGKPDLIVGHYSDGNLVSYLLADSLGVNHCALAHALEKSKYLFSDIRWQEFEHDYRFSLQFTADLLAYNSADFIITSTHREIAGDQTEMGMYESYETFTMPGLYQVKSGMDPNLARYNIVPPGVNEEYFYPYTESVRRVTAIRDKMAELMLENYEGVAEPFYKPDLPPIMTIARVDKVKNVAGLVDLYGAGDLREYANLVLISSVTDPDESQDIEERAEIEKIRGLIDKYNLHGHIRWIGARLTKMETGEVYRVVAERQGVFAQPALMETFGLTVIEAMACGLPVVVTCYGGPAEIVEDEKSGFIRNPNDMAAFAEACKNILINRELWQSFSDSGIQRVDEHFNWRSHASKVLSLANVHSYWNYLDVMNREALDRYIHTLYHAVYRPRAVSGLNGN